MIHTSRQKRAAKRAVDKARRDMEADVYSKLDEDGGKKLIYKIARDRDENSKDVKGGTVMKDRNGKLVTEPEAVLKVWESYFKELLNQERNYNDLELPSYVEEKVELTDITDTEMQTGIKGMKKGRAPGIEEMRVEMVMAAGESGISWTKRLLNTCMRQGGMADRANSTNMEEGRCTKPREIPRHHTSKSHHEAAREDPGCEDPKESRARIG